MPYNYWYKDIYKQIHVLIFLSEKESLVSLLRIYQLLLMSSEWQVHINWIYNNTGGKAN